MKVVGATPARIVLVVVSLAVAACNAGAPPLSSPLVTSTPPIALGDSPPTATSQEDGIVVELWLDARDVALGDRLLALVRVTNRGNTSPTWESNICGFGPAHITVEGPAGLPEGRSWDGLAAEFKREVLAEFGAVRDGHADLGSFWDAEMIDVDNMACPAYSQVRPFVPGQSVQKLLAWDARAKPGLNVTAGQATVTARFESSAGSVTAETVVEIKDSSPRTLTVVDYVDTALAQPDYAAWLEELPRSSWINTSVTFWPNEEGRYPPRAEYDDATTGAVDVGLIRNGANLEEGGAVIIDTGTGEVLGTRFDE